MSFTTLEYINLKVIEVDNYNMPASVLNTLEPHTLVAFNFNGKFVPLNQIVPSDHIYEFAGILRSRGYIVDRWEMMH